MPTKTEQIERKKFLKLFLKKLYENLEEKKADRKKGLKRIKKSEYLKPDYINKKKQYAPNFVQKRVEKIFDAMTSEEKKEGRQGIINILYNTARGKYPEAVTPEAMAISYGGFIAG